MDYEDSTFIELTKLVSRTASQQAFFTPVNFVSIMRFVPAIQAVSMRCLILSLSRLSLSVAELFLFPKFFQHFNIQRFIQVPVNIKNDC